MNPRAARRVCLAVLAGLAAACSVAIAADPPAPALKSFSLGEGPTLVFLHSIGGARSTWMPTARSFAGRWRIVVADLPGHGETPMLEPFNLKRVAEEVGKLIAAQPSDTVILVTLGFGALAALEAAAAKPPKLRGLIVLEAAPTNPLTVDQRKMFERGIDEAYDDLLRMLTMRMSVDSTRGVRLHAQAAMVQPAVVKAYLRESLYSDLAGRVKEVAVPVLFVASDRSWPREDGWAAIAQRYGYAAIPKARGRRIENSGPAIMVDQPDTLRAAIAAWADSVRAGQIR